jgi:hypothetical protein
VHPLPNVLGERMSAEPRTTSLEEAASKIHPLAVSLNALNASVVLADRHAQHLNKVSSRCEDAPRWEGPSPTWSATQMARWQDAILKRWRKRYHRTRHRPRSLYIRKGGVKK